MVGKEYLVHWINNAFYDDVMVIRDDEAGKKWLEQEKQNVYSIYRTLGEVSIDDVLNSDGEPLGG